MTEIMEPFNNVRHLSAWLPSLLSLPFLSQPTFPSHKNMMCLYLCWFLFYL